MDDKIRTLKEIHVNIYDMALTKSTDILLSIYGSSDVKLLTNSFQWHNYYQLEKRQNVLTLFYLYVAVHMLNC